MKRNILLNPGPATTTDTVKQAQVVPDICPREKEFSEIMQSICRDLLKIVHADTKKYTAVLFCGSGTINLDICINSLLPEGKMILIINNGAYSSRAVEIAAAYKLASIELRFPVDELPDMDVIEHTLIIHPDIAVVYTTHNETGTGILNPIREIGRLAHQYGAVSIIDTTSTYAMRPIDIEKYHIDFCMASAQKGIQAMTGLSFVIGKRSLIEASKNYPKRSYYCNLYLQYESFKTTGQMKFTPPVQAIYAARQALDEYFLEGEQSKWKRHKRVFEAIHQGLESLGLRTIIDKKLQAGLVVAVRYPVDGGWSFEKIHDYCYVHGFTIYPGKISETDTFRLCALGAIDTTDIEKFFGVLKAAMEHYGVTLPVKY